MQPASAAITECSPISEGVIGRAGDIVGVCIEPVMAHVIITLFWDRHLALLTVDRHFTWSPVGGRKNLSRPPAVISHHRNAVS
jgi:hypothetical protein